MREMRASLPPIISTNFYDCCTNIYVCKIVLPLQTSVYFVQITFFGSITEIRTTSRIIFYITHTVLFLHFVHTYEYTQYP